MNKKFEDYFKNILKEADYKEFISQIKSGSVRRGMRVNRLLAPLGINEVKSDFTKLKNIPWSPDGYFYESEESIGNTVGFKEGKIYSQEASSQIAVELLEPCEGDYILDLCASPGSKTTQIASEVGNRAVVIANEITPNRYVRLRENLQHFGVVCHAITGLDPGFFAKNYPNTFDRILVDAPCSGEGMYFKFPAVIDHWNPKTIRFNAKRQRKILTDAFIALKPGGRLVYSTCTLNLEENEKVVAHILKKFFQNAEIVNIDSKKYGFQKGGARRKPGQSTAAMLKIWPHEFKTGGFFACVLTKNTPSEVNIYREKFHLTARQKRQAAHRIVKKNVRDGWNVCMRKEEMSILKVLSKEMSLRSISLPKMFAVVKHGGEYFLQMHSFYKHFAGLPIKWAGIKICDINKKPLPETLVWLKTLQ